MRRPSSYLPLSVNRSWLLDITGTGHTWSLRGRSECPPWREDLVEPPHHRPVHRTRLQVRVVL